MIENVENLILEPLRIIRADMSAMKEEMSGMRVEMISMRRHMAGLLATQTMQVQDGEIANIKVRLDRIEKRLDLVE